MPSAQRKGMVIKMKYKVVLIIYRVIFIIIALWLSWSEFLVYAMVLHGEMNSEFVQFILIVIAVIVLMTSGDFLIFNRMRRKTDDRELYKFSKIINGVSIGVVITPFSLCFLDLLAGGFIYLIRSIVPVVSSLLLLAYFLFWLGFCSKYKID